MKIGKLRVGAKGTREAVTVPVREAENVDDMEELSNGSADVVVRCFNRGWRIESQERSGAREAFREGKTEAEIASIVAGYDPTVVKPRAPRAPKVVELTPGKETYSRDELAALLAAKGIQVQVAGAGA